MILGIGEEEPIEGEGQVDGEETGEGQGEPTAHSKEDRNTVSPHLLHFLDEKTSAVQFI